MNRKMTTCFATLVVLFFSAGIQLSQASETIEKVLVNKQFEVHRGVNLNVSHEFGKVLCKNWDQSTISVKITAKVSARSEEKANNILDRISTKVNGNSDEVNATCRLSSGKNNNNQKIELTMEIMMPKWVNLTLDHSFGSSWIGKVSGNAHIESEYGNLTIGALTGDENVIELSFGKATIDLVSDLDLEVSYGKTTIEQVNNLKLETSYSDVSIQQAQQVRVELEGGNFEVGSIASIEGESDFTNIDINSLSNAARMELSYGGFHIKQVASSFTMIALESDFSNVSLTVDQNAAYQLKMKSEFGSLVYPTEKAVVSIDIQELTDRRLEAVIGEKSNPDALINITSNYGSIKIK